MTNERHSWSICSSTLNGGEQAQIPPMILYIMYSNGLLTLHITVKDRCWKRFSRVHKCHGLYVGTFITDCYIWLCLLIFIYYRWRFLDEINQMNTMDWMKQ